MRFFFAKYSGHYMIVIGILVLGGRGGFSTTYMSGHGSMIDLAVMVMSRGMG